MIRQEQVTTIILIGISILSIAVVSPLTIGHLHETPLRGFKPVVAAIELAYWWRGQSDVTPNTDCVIVSICDAMNFANIAWFGQVLFTIISFILLMACEDLLRSHSCVDRLRICLGTQFLLFAALQMAMCIFFVVGVVFLTNHPPLAGTPRCTDPVSQFIALLSKAGPTHLRPFDVVNNCTQFTQ